ncbi:MAG TPA: lanthionine synthetase LanC family protein [Solirubrobacter sp.]|nr:lanthionine synthetase LanC family protein [Solirubrobacter sp.]
MQRSDAAGLADAVLEHYATAANGTRTIYGHDAGPVVLAGVAHGLGAIDDDRFAAVARRWFDELADHVEAVGAFGGLGGFSAGIRALIAVDDGFAPLQDALEAQTRRVLAGARWRTSAVAWVDYDLFRGPSGLVLSGTPDASAPAAVHLARLCDEPGLERLRAGSEISAPSAFNIGRINTGMGHGVTGVASALRHAVETFGDAYRPPLRRACDWLVGEAYLAERDFITWPPVGRDAAEPTAGADRRQAWCYGTPGVAWALWDAGRVLGDGSLRLLGEEAMRSFCRVYDPDFSFPIHDASEELAVCHGMAGTLAVADAFARHAALPEAQALRAELAAALLDRAGRVADIARTDMSVLNGAGGIVAVLLSACGGPREWLCQLALR